MGLLWEFPYFVEHGEGEASEVLFTVQVIEGVCVAAEDDGGGHAGEPIVQAGEPGVRIYCLAEDVR